MCYYNYNFNSLFYFSPVILKIRNILLITDISFLENVANYFKALFADVKLPQLQDTTTKEPEAAKEQETAKVLEAAKEKQDKGKEAKKLNIPTIKLDANIQDFRVALIETVESPEPQALTLKVCIELAACRGRGREGG